MERNRGYTSTGRDRASTWEEIEVIRVREETGQVHGKK